MPTRAVLVCVRISMAPATTDEQGDPAAHMAAEPEHDHQSQHYAA